MKSKGQLIRQNETVFVWQNPDGTYRIGIRDMSAIAKPQNQDWQAKVKMAIAIEDDEQFEDELYKLMKP